MEYSMGVMDAMSSVAAYKVPAARGGKAQRVDCNMRVGAAAIDFTDAFCRINRKKTVQQYLDLGGDARYARLLWDFLGERTQQVRINGVLSDPVTLQLGAPQGTGIGPWAWLLFVNDLLVKLRAYKNRPERKVGYDMPRGAAVKNPDNRVRVPFKGLQAYADDSLPWFAGPDLAEIYKHLDGTCQIYDTWSKENDVPISPKSKIFIHRAKAPTSAEHPEIKHNLLGANCAKTFNCGGIVMKPETDEMRFLGVWFDSANTGGKHVEKLLPTLVSTWSSICAIGDPPVAIHDGRAVQELGDVAHAVRLSGVVPERRGAAHRTSSAGST